MIKPLMRELLKEGKLTGAAKQLMDPMPYEMLYDTEADPHEIKNLAGSPEHQSVLLTMRSALDTWQKETGDRGSIPEPTKVVAPFKKEMHDWFGTPKWAGH